MVRFHLDEHVSPAIATGLRQRDIDVTTTVDAGLIGASDAAQREFALAEGRVIVTHDDDFLVDHAKGIEHAGIAFCVQGKYAIGDLLRAIVLLNGCCTEEELRNRVEFL